MISLLIPIGLLAIIIFGLAAVMEGKGSMKKTKIIRSLYFYIASLITLIIVVGSVIYLINSGLKNWVFTEADAGPLDRLGPPPSLYLGDTSSIKEVDILENSLSCDGDCSLTEGQQSSIDAWVISYQTWQEAKTNPGSQRARDAVVALSFLIVALPFYIIHFRNVQKEAKHQAEESDRSVIRPVYFYFVSLGSLIMMVVAGGFLINLVLKTWVFPSAGEADKITEKIQTSPVVFSPESDPVKSLVTCGEQCGLSQETITLAGQWTSDYDTWQNEINDSNNTQRQAATAIPFVLIGIPLFWYHWAIVRRESKEKNVQENQTEKPDIS